MTFLEREIGNLEIEFVDHSLRLSFTIGDPNNPRSILIQKTLSSNEAQALEQFLDEQSSH